MCVKGGGRGVGGDSHLTALLIGPQVNEIVKIRPATLTRYSTVAKRARIHTVLACLLKVSLSVMCGKTASDQLYYEKSLNQ